MARQVQLREVADVDLPIFFEHQRDPDATRLAAFKPREREAFMAHWARIRTGDAVIVRTIHADGSVAGYIASWMQDGQREIGYWLGKELWGQGIATQALAQFLCVVELRPLYAYVAPHNLGSIRVLEKCGFAIVDEDRRSSVSLGEIEGVILRLDAPGGSSTEDARR